MRWCAQWLVGNLLETVNAMEAMLLVKDAVRE
jgi:hypothetical protein